MPSFGIFLCIPAGFFDGLTGADSFNKTFYGCTSLKTIPERLFAKNTNATTVQSCFQNCTALQAVPAGLFGTTTKTKTLTSMFADCSSLATIAPDAFSGVNAASGTVMKIFQNCKHSVSVGKKLIHCKNMSLL